MIQDDPYLPILSVSFITINSTVHSHDFNWHNNNNKIYGQLDQIGSDYIRLSTRHHCSGVVMRGCGGVFGSSTCVLHGNNSVLHVRGGTRLAISTKADSFVSKSSGVNHLLIRELRRGGGGRRRMSVTAAATATESLRKGIAEFYDESSGIWEDIWGDHMHHGFYEPGSDVSLSDHRTAQIRMIEESLRFAGVGDDSTQKPRNIVDVGCGIGGSSRYLARKFEAKAQGITLSPVQAQRAQQLADAQGLDGKVLFQVADALNQPFPDGQFDLVWSMESGEHMPDKTKFVNELVRVAAPGGTLIIVTWCHRDLSPSEESLSQDEKDLLKKICDAFYLPAWCSTADYVKLLQSHSLEDIKSADWSQYVAPFWPAVIKSALTWKGLTSLLRSGWKTIKGAFAMPLMIEGYKKGLIKFAIITCKKPVS